MAGDATEQGDGGLVDTPPSEASGWSGRAVAWVAKLFFAAAALLLGLFALGLLGVAVVDLVKAGIEGRPLLVQALESIGLITIAVAVFHVAKFLLEEELIGERQLRSVLEARRSLTKFFTIVIITLSIEGVVLVFETKLEDVDKLMYPTLLMAVSVFALIGLGLFQYLSAEGGSNQIGPDAAKNAAGDDGRA